MYTTPGVYFQWANPSRGAIGPLRTDITGFLGYTERGPLLAPLKVSGWRQFTTAYGAPLPYAHLAYAVKGFFDNGGAECYVVRIADPGVARAALVTLLGEGGIDALRVWASHGQLHNPATGHPQVGDDGRPERYDSPGAWGNRLSVSIQPAGLGITQTLADQPEDGLTSEVENLSGFEEGTIVRLSQGGTEAPEFRRVSVIDARLRDIRWDTPLTGLGFDLSLPIRLESVEFTLLVHSDGQVVERHRNLSLSNEHSRYVVDVLQANSSLVDVDVLLDLAAGDWRHPDHWPVSVDRMLLTDGHDGLASVDKDDFLAGLAALEKVDEVSVLAAPDLVLKPEAPASRPRSVPRADLCQVLAPPPSGQLVGVVRESRGETEDIPLAGVSVRALENASASTVTNGAGEFVLTNLPVGRVTLLFEREGYYGLEATAQARTFQPSDAALFYLTPITLPPALSLDDIFDVQEAMLRQGESGLYRMAVLDPPPTPRKDLPAEVLDLEEIQTWRARFDSAYAALYYPWLTVRDEAGSGVRDVPPSGHMAGLIARTDLTQGIHRAPANFVLEGVKALTKQIDAVQQSVLNPLGINCIRALPGRGIRVFGARTLGSDPEWRYLNVRRLVLMIEEAIEEASQWAVFEPNDHVLRQALTYSLSSFLNTLWRQGALAGDAPGAAYRVKCDEDNNPPNVVEAGQVIAEVGVAPTIPFEFITFRLGRTVEAVEVRE